MIKLSVDELFEKACDKEKYHIAGWEFSLAIGSRGAMTIYGFTNKGPNSANAIKITNKLIRVYDSNNHRSIWSSKDRSASTLQKIFDKAKSTNISGRY